VPPFFCSSQPKWNDRLLEAFKVDYIGAEPYISCTPSLRHHRISSNDRFLVLSSDGLYQYFTNKEVVDQVAMFTAEQPDGDPAKHLVGELVLRAARKAGEQNTMPSCLTFNRLLQI
jgi:serine/threonine protein phosphatase PrpC